MTIIKKFLDQRAEGLAKEKKAKQGEDFEEDKNLTDDEFWGILKQFKQETRSGKKDASEILQEILEQYPVLKINQFAERYTKLNK